MTESDPQIPGYRHRHLRQTREFASRHFTDPAVSIEDAAVFLDIDMRTLRASLSDLNTSWRAILRELRSERAAELLAKTKYTIEQIARLSGYDSPPAFAKMFKQTYRLTPSEYRRAKKGPARAGGATGAFARKKSTVRPGIAGGWDAVTQAAMDEAAARIADRHLMQYFNPLRGITIEQWAREVDQPQRARDQRDRWRGWRKRFDEWVHENQSTLTEDEGFAGDDAFVEFDG